MIKVISEQKNGSYGVYTVESDEGVSAVLAYCIRNYKSHDNYKDGVLHRIPYGLEKSEYEKRYKEADAADDGNKMMSLAGDGWYHLEKVGNVYHFTTHCESIY